MSEFDVIVGGSGMAGLSAANRLIKGGYKVAVVSSGYGRPIVCDCLTKATLDKWKAEFNCDIPTYKVIPAHREVSPSGKIVDTEGVWGVAGYLMGNPDQGRGPSYQAILKSLVEAGVTHIPEGIKDFVVRDNHVEVNFGERATCNALILALGTNYGESVQRALDRNGIEAPFCLRESVFEVELDIDTPDLSWFIYDQDLSRLHGWLLDQSKAGESHVALAIAHLDGEDPNDKLQKWLVHPYFKGKLRVKGGRRLCWNLSWAPSRKPYCARVITCGEMAGQAFPDMYTISQVNAYRSGKLAAEILIKNFEQPTEEGLSQFYTAYEAEILRYGFTSMHEWVMDLYTAFICHDNSVAESVFNQYAGEPFPRILHEIGKSWRVYRCSAEREQIYLRALAESGRRGGELDSDLLIS